MKRVFVMICALVVTASAVTAQDEMKGAAMEMKGSGGATDAFIEKWNAYATPGEAHQVFKRSCGKLGLHA